MSRSLFTGFKDTALMSPRPDFTHLIIINKSTLLPLLSGVPVEVFVFFNPGDKPNPPPPIKREANCQVFLWTHANLIVCNDSWWQVGSDKSVQLFLNSTHTHTHTCTHTHIHAHVAYKYKRAQTFSTFCDSDKDHIDQFRHSPVEQVIKYLIASRDLQRICPPPPEP